MHDNPSLSDQFCLTRKLSDRTYRLIAKASSPEAGANGKERMDVFNENLDAPRDDRVRERARQEQAQYEALCRISVSLAFMMQHLNQPLRIAALSAKAGVSNSHFYCLFKCATGYAPNDFLIRARLQRACRLLERTTLNVKEIAALLGYRDQYYFSRQFKIITNVSPSEYRLRRFGSGLMEQTSPQDFEKARGRPFAAPHFFPEESEINTQTMELPPKK